MINDTLDEINDDGIVEKVNESRHSDGGDHEKREYQSNVNNFVQKVLITL